MSCSDKICRWALLGMQGGVLSNWVAPISLESVVVSIDPASTRDDMSMALERGIRDRASQVYKSNNQIEDLWNLRSYGLSTEQTSVVANLEGSSLSLPHSLWKPPMVYVCEETFAYSKSDIMTKMKSSEKCDVQKIDESVCKFSRERMSKRQCRGHEKKKNRVDASPLGINWFSTMDEKLGSLVEVTIGATGLRQGFTVKCKQKGASRLSRATFHAHLLSLREVSFRDPCSNDTRIHLFEKFEQLNSLHLKAKMSFMQFPFFDGWSEVSNRKSKFLKDYKTNKN
mmetsp:Transcript_36323/g.50453  ORF Transcript_36323/g.50453 Transcript_36323/m.50453 type:complete len:284 (-) Transcript_36323:25-876(-)